MQPTNRPLPQPLVLYSKRQKGASERTVRNDERVIRTQERALVTGQQFDPIVSLVPDGLTSEHNCWAYERVLTDLLNLLGCPGQATHEQGCRREAQAEIAGGRP